MFRTRSNTFSLIAAAALSLMLMGSAATAQLTVDIMDREALERKEIPVNSKEKIALTAQASGGSGLTFQWELLGVGSLGDVTKSAIFYYPPTTIDGDTEQAIITLHVKDADGNEAQSGVTLTIVGGEIPPTPKPKEEPGDCSANYNPTPDDFEEDVWKPSDCTCVKVNDVVIGYGFHKEKTENESWRRENEAFVKAIRLARQYHSPEALIYSVKGGESSYQDIHRFKIKSGTTVYYTNFEKDAQIQYGTCLKKVGEVDRRVFGSMIVEKQEIYIIETR